MRRSSDRAQAEPLAALAAVFAVAVAMAIYTGALDDAVPPSPDTETPETVLDRVQRAVQTTGVARPGRLDAAVDSVPEGWHANVTLTAGGSQWVRGPVPPESARRARSRISVRLGPTTIAPGQLRVVVWQ